MQYFIWARSQRFVAQHCSLLGSLTASTNFAALRVLCSHSTPITHTHTDLQLQSRPPACTNMYSLRHFHIGLRAQLLALTSSYVQSVTPTLNYNHTLTLPFRSHQQCCPPPPTLNYPQMWLNLQFCTSNPPLPFASTYAQQPSLGCTSAHHVHAWKYQASFILTLEWGFFSLNFPFSGTQSTHFLLSEEQKDLLFCGLLPSQKITLNPCLQ